ncbi:MAG: 4Fe-4S dicluster domain-containing protein [bacterium]|nr:4Fe-4S dicluster domain-containing protein [bacterium]
MLSVLEIVLFFAALVATVWFSQNEFRRKFKLIGYGKEMGEFDNMGKRIVNMLKRVILQICVFPNRPIPGFFHAMIFWGFLVFLLITTNHILEGFIEGFCLFGHGIIYDIVMVAANFFAGMLILAVIYFVVRRYIFRPSTLEIPSYESLIILIFIFTLMVSFLYLEAFRMYEHEAASSNFLSAFVHNSLMPAKDAIAAGTIFFWERFLWWIHLLVVLGFAVFIPHSKHLHLVMGPINILFRNEGVKAEIPFLNLEEQEKFGTPNINDFTQKDLMDLFSCAECGRCDDVCPAFNTGKDLSPKTLLSKLKDNLFESEEALGKENPELKTLLADVVSENEIWDCTTCAACMEVCPMFNEHISKIMGMRQYGVLMESKFPEEFNALFKGLENQGNPWGINAQTRTEWAAGLDVPVMSDKGETDVLLWIGCEGSFDAHNQKSTQTFIEVLKKADVDFAYLGNEELCCGDPARRSGHEYLYQMMPMQNIEILNNYKFKRIVTMCPHCFHVLKHEYPQMDGNYEVVHYSDFLLELLKENKLKVKNAPDLKLTYHDPCYLGRYNDTYDSPRELLKAISGNLKEMKNNKETSFCCGAGGSGMWKEESKGDRINHTRIKHAADTGADTIVTGCPYCSLMFKDAIDETGTKNLKNADLIQIIYDNLDR